MNITQSFYDELAPQYDKLFQDWSAATYEQAGILQKLIAGQGFDESARILDCACGIGTQAIGLSRLGSRVTASDISPGALAEAENRAMKAGVKIPFEKADFCTLSEVFPEAFDIVVAMDNALPHMLSGEDLEKAIHSIVNQIRKGGIFIGSIRNYDALLQTKPSYSPPYIHKTERGQRVAFQTWDWNGDRYKLVQYIVEDEGKTMVSKFACEYRAVRREEMTNRFLASGCRQVDWLFPEETGFYQPVVIARK